MLKIKRRRRRLKHEFYFDSSYRVEFIKRKLKLIQARRKKYFKGLEKCFKSVLIKRLRRVIVKLHEIIIRKREIGKDKLKILKQV